MQRAGLWRLMIPASHYRREREEIDRQMPRASGKVVEFDRYWRAWRDMSGLLARGKPDQLRELISTLVERIEAWDRQLVSISWVPPAARSLRRWRGPCGIRTHDTRIKSPLL
jgi:hypothetical protein